MILSEITLDEFLCEGKRSDTSDPVTNFEDFERIYADLVGGKICDLGQGYAIHSHGYIYPGNVALLHQGNLVGFYVSVLLEIHPDHQGKKLSIPLVLAAVADRDLPETRIVGTAGLAALKAAWEVAHGIRSNPWPCV